MSCDKSTLIRPFPYLLFVDWFEQVQSRLFQSVEENAVC